MPKETDTCVERCTDCGGKETNHRIVKEETGTYIDEGTRKVTTYTLVSQIIECLGCNAVRFRQFRRRGNNPFEFPETAVYPEPQLPKREAIESKSLPKDVAKIYQETLATMDAKANTLCALGLRAIVEGICRDKSINEPNLQKKIDGLVSAGVLSVVQADYLHESRYLGNDAAHELKTPKSDELAACLEIIESLLTAIYILPTHSDRLKKRRGIKVAPSTSGRKRKPKT